MVSTYKYKYANTQMQLVKIRKSVLLSLAQISNDVASYKEQPHNFQPFCTDCTLILLAFEKIIRFHELNIDSSVSFDKRDKQDNQ